MLDIAGLLADVARSWRAEEGVAEVSSAVVRSATIAVPGVRQASISLLGPKRALATVAQTDPLIAAVDKVQYAVGEGPCVDAAMRRGTFRVDELAEDRRWPAFASTASRMGLRSMLSFQLYVVDANLGALNLASERGTAFDERAEQIGRFFAAHAAIAVAESLRNEQLGAAISTRDLIGQAKGILMQRYRISGEAAFAWLVRTSQYTNVKLRVVAADLVQDVEEAAPRDRVALFQRPVEV